MVFDVIGPSEIRDGKVWIKVRFVEDNMESELLETQSSLLGWELDEVSCVESTLAKYEDQ
jgi:hypothetical protein